VDRGYGEVLDFFQAKHRTDVIVSNPPYGQIEPFIMRALERTTDRVIVLARLALLEGIRRKAMFTSTPFARVWVSSRRVSMPPGGSSIEAKGGSVAFAWFVWQHRHAGPATVHWLP
jgi:hypothetical protein